MRVIVLGLSLSSSWGNGHATTYRALLRALAARGHEILFLERDVPWYAENRDLPCPVFCDLRFYESVEALDDWRPVIAAADAVLVGSYVLEGIAAIDLVQRAARGVTAFYDIDTPVTLSHLAGGTSEYLAARQIPGFDLYFSFTGGPTLQRLERQFGARAARVLYCSVDPELYQPREAPRRWDLGYIGTYSPDRQPVLERLLLEPARRAPHRRFVVAGPLYPPEIAWPANVERIDHLSPADHRAFYSSLGWALNVTRADMVAAGFSPSVRLFEAASCGVPIISDHWPGLDSILEVGPEIVVAASPEEVLATLSWPEHRRAAIASAARQHVLAEHTAAHRAFELEACLRDALDQRREAAAIAAA